MNVKDNVNNFPQYTLVCLQENNQYATKATWVETIIQNQFYMKKQKFHPSGLKLLIRVYYGQDIRKQPEIF